MPLCVYPEHEFADELLALPADAIAQRICQEIVAAVAGHTIEAIGVGFPGIIRCGIIEESPNLQQLKGANMQETLSAALRRRRAQCSYSLYNDADIVAAGLAATRGQLDSSPYASGPSVMASVSASILTPRASGRVGTS